MSAETIERWLIAACIAPGSSTTGTTGGQSMLCLSSPGFQIAATILLGEKIKANSWVVGVKVFADHIWQRVLPGEYQSLLYRGARFACPKSSIWVRWK
jgi:hypothetical protein